MTKKQTKKRAPWIAKVTLPMFYLMIAAVLLVYFASGLVTWLPNSMKGRTYAIREFFRTKECDYVSMKTGSDA